MRIRDLGANKRKRKMFCLVSVENCFEKSAPRRKFISSLKVWRREVVNLLAEILILFLNKEMDVFYFCRQELENFLLSNYAEDRGPNTEPFQITVD